MHFVGYKVNPSLPPANELLGKVIFLHLSVILFTGGSTWAGTLQPGTPPGQVHPPAGILSTSGLYASYWNAFLFDMFYRCIFEIFFLLIILLFYVLSFWCFYVCFILWGHNHHFFFFCFETLTKIFSKVEVT